MNQSLTLNIDDTRRELQGFRDYYVREIEPWMTAQQERQRRARWWAVKVGAVGIMVTALSVWLLFLFVGPFQQWEEWVVVPVALGLLSTLVAVAKLGALQKQVRGFLLERVCAHFGFEYRKTVGDVGFEDFAQSGLLPRHDRHEMEDHFRGRHNGVEFDFFECTLEVKKKAIDPGTGQPKDSWHKVYHGVLFRLDFPKRFNGRTLVFKDAGLIGNYLKDAKIAGDRVKLEDPRFEKLFEVWGTDQIEARYLLTPTFMERVVALAEPFKAERFELSFFNNLLLVSAQVKEDQFEGGGMFTGVTDQRRVEGLINEICRVFDIVDTLQLNLRTRI